MYAPFVWTDFDMILSVAIIARDEEHHIDAALRSASPVADEIVVLLDPRTTDRTAEIAQKHGATVIVEPFQSHAAQRNRALAWCRGDWVLFLDADERLTPELLDEIKRLKETVFLSIPDEQTVGYWIPRFNLYWGHRLYGGGWYPDLQLRLLRRDRSHYDEQRLIHELATLDGSAGTLTEHLLHINIESLGELWRKQSAYAIKEAEMLYHQGARARPHNLILQPLREVKRRFWTWHGYRDGVLGLFLALTMGYFELVKYIRLVAMARRAIVKPR